MDSPHPAPGPAAGARAGWHYRDARGRACGPYDDDALERLYRFGHVRADTPVWRTGDEDTATPLRARRDHFRLHGDGRLDVLSPAAAVPSAETIGALPDTTPAPRALGEAPDAAAVPAGAAAPGTDPGGPQPAHTGADVADVPAPASSPVAARAATDPPKRRPRRGMAVAALLATAAAVVALLARLAS